MKSWQHGEHNINVELDSDLTLNKWGEDFLRIKLPEDKTNHRFYPINKDPLGQLKRIRRSVRGTLTPLQASSEYELMRTLPRSNDLVIATYIVEEPSIMVFDVMPTDQYMDVDEKGYATDFDYEDKQSYHPADIPIKPNLGKVQVVRIHSPYTVHANPYYMDEGLINVDIQYGFNGANDLQEKWLQAVKETVENYGLEVKQEGGKLFFKHGDRWVKFESSEKARGVLANYIIVDSAYNKAYDFYKPGVTKDIRNNYAYGLKNGNDQIGSSIVDEIIARLGDLLNLPIEDEPYHDQELTNWQTIEQLHADPVWIKEAKRNDASWFWRDDIDGFEHEFDLAEKPANNQFQFKLEHSGLEFYYQGRLTTEEIASGQYRPPDVEGSYAVYHPTKRDNRPDQSNYETGKVCHIYRPIVKDSKGLTYFADLNISNDLMTITVPEEFLNKATYPVTIDPTFGYTTAGASTNNITTNYLNLINQTGGAGLTNSISVYMNPQGAATAVFSVYPAIYRNSTLALVDYATQVQYSATGGVGWYAFNTTQNSTLSAVGYDIGLYVGETGSSAYNAVVVYYDTGTSGIGGSATPTYSSTPPGTEPTVTANTNKYSFYVTYGATFANKKWLTLMGV